MTIATIIPTRHPIAGVKMGLEKGKDLKGLCKLATLEEAKTAFETVCKKLEDERNVFKIQMAKIERDRDIYKRRSQSLAEKTVAYEESLLAHKRKVQNATRKIQIEGNKLDNIQNEIDKLKKEYKKLQISKAKQERSLRYFTQFYDFLNAAVQCSEEYGEINELISRAEALKSLHLELKYRESESLELIHQTRKSVQLMQLAKTEHLIENSNCLINKEREYDEIHAENLNRIERIISNVEAYVKTKEAYGTLKMAIMNIYGISNGHACKESNISLESALNYIKTCIEDLEQVNNLLMQDDKN